MTYQQLLDRLKELNAEQLEQTVTTFDSYTDEPSARKYLEGRLWKDDVTCPECKSKERITTRKDGFYRCNACKLDFTVRTGTIFERSHVPLHKWLYAMYLLVTARKGISSLQLGKEIGITQKSAWFVLHRLREACGTEIEKLRGTIEVDEAYFGGEENNRHMYDRIHKPRERTEKTIVVGMRQRGGNTVAKDEFTFRLNQGNVARHTTERLDSFVDAIKGKRLTFARLTA